MERRGKLWRDVPSPEISNSNTGKIDRIIESIEPGFASRSGLWRLVREHVATWTELQTTWSLADVEEANAALDINARINQLYAEGMPKAES